MINCFTHQYIHVYKNHKVTTYHIRPSAIENLDPNGCTKVIIISLRCVYYII